LLPVIIVEFQVCFQYMSFCSCIHIFFL
jgi:hypothetical protein